MRMRAALLLATLIVGLPAGAQERDRLTFVTQATFYVDNGEFFNRFREGESLLGTAATFAVDVALTDRATFRGGLFVNYRFGSERFVDQWRPVFRLTLESGRSRFILGTLVTGRGSLETGPRSLDTGAGPRRLAAGARDGSFGPDLDGSHGLLPPLQVETLAFTRPYEAGLQWLLDGERVAHDAWVSWQRLNTPDHRERFDAGVRGRIRIGNRVPIAIGYQAHHVHEGGQLFEVGPVKDSFAGGPGLIVEPRLGGFDTVAIETWVMWSTSVADRAGDDGARHGHGVFVRAAVTRNGWRGHLIAWGACDWLKEEGDPNYGSRLLDGTVFRPTRHYGELGIAKVLYEEGGVEVDGALRLHRIERDYEYSFRVLARVDLALPLRAP